MRTFFISLLLLPLLSCGKSTSTTEIPDLAYQTTNMETAQSMDHSKWNVLLQKNVSKNGIVDYKGFQKDSKQLQSYLDLLAANVPSKSSSKKAVLAYWINAYNAYTVKLILDNYPVKSIKDIKDPWGKKFFTLGTNKYSLEQIEHEILRKMGEPRIHFAINCASFSCPNLLNEAYTEAKIEKQLENSAKSFVNDKAKNTITADKIEVSEIFNWFSGDFKTKGTLIDFLNQYSSLKINKNAKVKFKDYNWSLNE
ncbi:DUF547 domain-containing protein [Flavobacterium frigoris]|uniref:Uncharacterized protein DUF547 n=1 Tax=Flavobacterium frigoris (strain PS1) TaxID=1086011 RepID=H7FS67_FLAFP|nr:DUF547 domain-containing protein [Flavobacterium frigoris]EIA08564.1 uncharacterized protein DUF547 [Flavobacterium frigoris PS1]